MQVQFNRLVPVSFLLVLVFGVAAAAAAKTNNLAVPVALAMVFLALSLLAMLIKGGRQRAGGVEAAQWTSKVSAWTGIAVLASVLAGLVFIAFRSI